jgi:2-polyprenyl-6-methoxyphenol hydroxylase-like FAD-dependent oxidoreductase
VTGIRGSDRSGAEVEEKARVVIGADGVRSLVADAVGAEKVVDAGSHTCGFYAYFSGMRDRNDAARLFVNSSARRFYITFPTNDDLDMVFLFWGREQTNQVRSNLEAAYGESLSLVPELADQVAGAKRETRIIGTHLLPNFIRRAHGPGWALVGDAAIHRDPITAQGITNAFTHASILAEELNIAFAGEQSIDTALASYDTRQFERLKPMFNYTVHMAMMQPTPDAVREILPQVAQDPIATGAFMGAFLGSVPLELAFSPQMIERFAQDVARGEAEVRDAA